MRVWASLLLLHALGVLPYASEQLDLRFIDSQSGEQFDDVVYFGPECDLDGLADSWFRIHGVNQTSACGGPACMAARLRAAMGEALAARGVTARAPPFGSARGRDGGAPLPRWCGWLRREWVAGVHALGNMARKAGVTLHPPGLGLPGWSRSGVPAGGRVNENVLKQLRGTIDEATQRACLCLVPRPPVHTARGPAAKKASAAALFDEKLPVSKASAAKTALSKNMSNDEQSQVLC